jgi:branched-chain amino acid transport system substrate-binding protein
VRRALLALAPALLLAACGRGGGGQVVFALAAPLEQDYGASTRRGAELAVREINAAGGIRGDSLRLELRDDGADKNKAIAIAAELLRDPRVVALAGPVNSGTTMASGPLYNGETDELAGLTLPVLATTATSPDVSRLGDWVFRVASSDSANAVELARVARAAAPAVAVLYSNDDYGRGLAAAFRGALLKDGGQVPEIDPYLEDTRDFTPYLKRIQRRGVGMVFVAGLDGSAARIIAQARGIGLAARFIGGDGLEPLKSKGPAYEGTLVGLLYHRDASDPARAFAEAYRRAYNAEADPFAAAAYDAVKLLAAAAGANGPTREGIQRYLRRLGQEGGPEPFVGATGTIRFDDNGDPLQKAFAVGSIQNGTLQLTRANR